MKNYYALNQKGTEASITIYGDITSWPWLESDVSSYLLSKKIESLNAETVHVYINSYGGEVSEGLAIYNALKRHKAKVVTHCDGFACSAASMVFMAGDERLMCAASLLMIHNAWQGVSGNAKELHKAADDLEAISSVAANAYRAAVNISEEELNALLDGETWIPPEDAVRMSFATGIENTPEGAVPAASAREVVMRALSQNAGHTTIDSAAIAACVVAQIQQMAEKSPPKVNVPENKLVKFLEALCARKEQENEK